MDDYDKYFNQLQSSRRLTSKGVEYWSARDLQGFLRYSSWERLDGVIARARQACVRSGQPEANHFHKRVNMVTIGSGAERESADWLLTRYACYLIAMNGDSSKPEIAYAQTYFALQTRRQEKAAARLSEIDQRLELRERMKSANKSLSSAAKQAGVRRYGVFHDAGYRGLYDGLSQADIKELKGVNKNESLLDRMGSAELAANYFRATQAEEKLTRDRVQGEAAATETHHRVGAEVRGAIERIGGVMPESMPPAAPLKTIKAQRKKLLEGEGKADG